MQSISSTRDGRRLRILIVDHHHVSRAACAALLRTEGLDVVDVPGAVGLVGLTWTWMPDVVLIDVNPPAPVRRILRQLRSLPNAPALVLTWSARPGQLHPSVAELPFLPKADICARAILAAVAVAVDERAIAAESQ
jgi:CheY-like chemotaxis protein